MQKLLKWEAPNNEESYLFFCPGCGFKHYFTVKGGKFNWTWNGSLEKPTVCPSVLISPEHPYARCHLFIEDGFIFYQQDCHHDYRGRKIPMSDV